MSDITFACPKCHQSLDAPEEIVGNLIECPTCKLIIEVPIRSQAAESPAPIPTPNPAPPPPPTQPESNRYVALFYICRNGQTVEGPLPADQLFSMIQRKELVPSVLVCVAGTDTWHPLNTMTDLNLAPAENSSDMASHRLVFGIGSCVAAGLLIFLSISLSGPSKKDKVDLEVLSVMVDTFIMNVDLGGQIGILNKESEKNSVLYEECIAESNRLKKVFSRQPEILNALHQQAYILKRWGHVNNGFESVTPRERKEDKKTLYDLKPKFDSLAR